MSLEYNAWRLREYLCSVCGLPLRCPDCDTGAFLEDRRTPLSGFDNDDAIAKLAKGEQWLDDVKLLCDPDDEAAHLLPSFSYENLCDFGVRHLDHHLSFLPPSQPLARSGIEEFQAEHMGGPCFYLDDHDGIRHEVNVDNWDFPTFDGRPYIPIHSACLNMAKRVIKDSSSKHLSNIRSLFISLRWRHAVSNLFGAARAEANYMLGPTCWYLHSELFWESGAYYPDESDKAQWPGPTQNGEFNLLYTFLGDPIEIESLTDTILSNLKPCRRHPVGADAGNLRDKLAALPEEIFQIVLSHLRSFRNLPRSGTYTLPQYFWKNELALAGKGLLPWLWDIDTDKINSKASEPCPGGEEFEWDWELLVRQLSRSVDGGIRHDVPEHVDIYDCSRKEFTYEDDLWTFTGYENDMKHVPRGLQNRRRIWQLLEEMFVGDQLPLVGDPRRYRSRVRPERNCVQLPWTKEGDLRDSAIWLPTINIHEAFARRIGGQVYRIPSKSPLQYWQTAKFRRDNGQDGEGPVEPASVPEVLDVIRKLGYPV